MTRLYSSLLSAALIFISVGAAAKMDPTYESIEAYLKKNPTCTIEAFLADLPEEMRSRYALVYESRSAHGASLKDPRIILVNSDASLIIGVAGSSEMGNGNRIELIRAEPNSSRLTFTSIALDGKSAEITTNPKACAACHAGPSAKRWETTLRPIWDSYPEWPGVFGSAHNDHASGRGWFGSSKRGDFEFERRALEDLKATASAHPRLKSLVDVEKLTLSHLANAATQLNEALNLRQASNVAQQIIDRLLDLRLKSPEKFREAIKVMDQVGNNPKPLAEVLAPEELGKFRKVLDENFARLRLRVTDGNKKLVEKYGTEADRGMLSDLEKQAEEYREYFRLNERLRDGKISGVQLLCAMFGIDPYSLSVAREYGARGLNHIGLNDPENTFWESLRPFIADPEAAVLKHRQALCRAAFVPTYLPDLNLGAIEWMRKMGLGRYADKMLQQHAL